ncbi:MAG: LysM peptidoglycan-binding domain-containing M23 family metallopeptidase [Anaerolineae bacterium]|nr:LysM peptidoglycan-binding domain-containing M23 family metallopeptidase [Anaerolineae bacterium]
MRTWLAVLLAAVGLCATAAAAHAQGDVYVVRPGENVSQLAARWGTSVEAIARANGLANPNLVLVGQRLIVPSGDGGALAAASTVPPPALPHRDLALPAPFASVRLSPQQPRQGQTVKIEVDLVEPARLTGRFQTETLRFAGDGQGGQWALVAIGPLAVLGQQTVYLTATTASGGTTLLRLPLIVRDGHYPVEDFYLDAETSRLLAPELIEGEAQRLEAIFKTGESLPLWMGPFIAPADGPITANFGERRRYNGGDARYHEGIDYDLATGTPVRAAAHGIVALAEPLTVRGNTVFIDHGMGVYSGYFHMSELLVSPGEAVKPGQVIGRVGSTGLSTGPHLHWEIRLHGINVSPWEWAEGGFP